MPVQIQASDVPNGTYNQWFGTFPEAPLFNELYRAAQWGVLYMDEQRRHGAVSRHHAPPLSRIIGQEARKLWKHWFERRNN